MSGAKLKLMCLVWPDEKPSEHISPVKIDDDDTVGDLKDMIKNKHSRLHNVDALDLVLWKCSGLPYDDSLEQTLKDIRLDGSDVRFVRLNKTWQRISQLFEDENLSKEPIQILIEVPDRGVPASLLSNAEGSYIESNAHPEHFKASDVIGNLAENTASSRKRRLVDHSHIIEGWRSKRLKNTVPSVEELKGVLKKPLLESEKVPITESFYTSLISMLLPDRCDEDTIGTLFKIGELDPNLLLFFSAVATSSPVGGTSNSFISFWDDNIRKPLELLIPTGKSIRNSNQHTETRKLRPDFAFLVKGVCSFRGEEKGPENFEDPKAELANKLNWVYEPAPYMLGYYCRGSEMTLAAIIAPDSKGSKPKIHDLICLDLRWRKDRIANLRHLINLSSTLPPLTDLVRFPVDDFKQLVKTNSIIEITSTRVIKTYTCENPGAKVTFLRGIYEVIATKNIPNTDALVFAHKNVVHLSPRGIAGQPLVEKELRECVICVLESLIVAHQVPIYHRDIRWNNVIRRIEDHSKWFLIDWEDAALPPTKAQPSFARSNHSPAIFEDGHGSDVDVWGVGHLIRTCDAADVSVELRALGKRICAESLRLSAQEVLTLVNTTQTGCV